MRGISSSPTYHLASLSSSPSPKALFLSRAPPEKMQYNGPTFRRPRTTPEQQYLSGVIVETILCVCAQSRWRGHVDLARYFLAEGIAHLPQGSPIMYRLNEVHDGVTLKLLTVTFNNPFEAYELLGEVFWCGYRCIIFTNYNIFTNYTSIFPNKNHMHCLPYDKWRWWCAQCSIAAKMKLFSDSLSCF
jgi:hypothetical protein